MGHDFTDRNDDHGLATGHRTLAGSAARRAVEAEPCQDSARNVAESKAFAGEPVDLEMLEEEHARRDTRPDGSKVDAKSFRPR